MVTYIPWILVWIQLFCFVKVQSLWNGVNKLGSCSVESNDLQSFLSRPTGCTTSHERIWRLIGRPAWFHLQGWQPSESQICRRFLFDREAIQQEFQWFICLHRFSCKEMPRSFFCRTRLPYIDINVIQFSSIFAASCALFWVRICSIWYPPSPVPFMLLLDCMFELFAADFGSFSHWWNSHGGGQWIWVCAVYDVWSFWLRLYLVQRDVKHVEIL